MVMQQIHDEVEGMGHRTPLDVFINMYNKNMLNYDQINRSIK